MLRLLLGTETSPALNNSGGFPVNAFFKASLPLVLVLTACGSSKSTKDVADNIGDHNELAGAWQGDCHAPNFLADLLKGGYTQVRYDFGNIQNSFKRSLTAFNNKNCDQSWFTYDIAGHYDVVTTAAPVDGGKSINITVEKVSITPKVGDAVDLLNAASLCGAKDWQINKEKVVTDKDCGGLKVSTGQVIADIYKVDNTKLMVGASSFFDNGLDAGNRPTKLDQDQVYTKK